MCSLPPTKSQLTYKHTYDITILIFSHIKRLWDCPKNTDKNTEKKIKKILTTKICGDNLNP